MNRRELFPEEFCTECGKELTTDDVGLYRKLVSRGARTFLCVGCLAKQYGISVEKLEERIKAYKESGCTLFM